MSNNPVTPNFVPGVGQLATSRYDFQEHVDGAGFRHNATQIDLTTPILGATTVEQALINIAGDLNPVIPQATIGTSTSNLGLITLGGDLQGTALIPKVIGLRNVPISSTLPSVAGQVLTYNGSSWGPAAPYVVPAPVIYASLQVAGTTTILPTDGTVFVGATGSFPYTITLPKASLVLPGRYYIVKDDTGTAGYTGLAGQSLYVAGNGSDTFDGAAGPYRIDNPYQAVGFISDGISNWQIENLSNKSTYYNSEAISFVHGGSINVSNVGALNINSTGTLSITSGGLLNVNQANGLVLTSAGDFVKFGTAHTRTIWNTFTPLYAPTGWSLANSPALSTQTNSIANFAVCKLDNLHNGATLTSITVLFQVYESHTGVPAFLPGVGIMCQKLGTNSNSQQGLYDNGGNPIYYLPTPGSGSAYYNGGNYQTLTMVTNTSLNVIDTSNYSYWILLVDESGSNSHPLNNFFGYAINYTNITSDQFP